MKYTIAKPTVEMVAEWLTKLNGHGGATEIRSLLSDTVSVPKIFRPGTKSRTIATYALVQNDRAKAVYVSLNPLRADQSGASCADDVTARRRLLIDMDPERPDRKSNSTDAEKAHAYAGILAIREHLAGRGWPDPILADSGNGYHLVFAIDLPNDEPAKKLITNVLKALAKRFNTAEAKVDTGVTDACRLVKVYGTMPRKGPRSDERPYRHSRMLEAPDALEVVPAEMLEELANEAKPPPKPSSNGPTPYDDWGRVTATDDTPQRAWFRKAIANECGKLANAAEGDRHNVMKLVVPTLFGQVHHGYITAEEVEWELRHAGLRSGLPEAEVDDLIRWGREKATDLPWPEKLDRPQAEQPKSKSQTSGGSSSTKPDPEKPTEDPFRWIEGGESATLADVRRELGDTRYLWNLWIALGSLTAIIAEGGIGKTRFMLDLALRLWLQLAWPDGSPNTFPAGTKTLWLCYDRHWRGLMDTAKAFGLPEEAILLPSHKGKPLWIPDFDSPKTMPLLERLIRHHKPGFLAIDTTTYATRYDTAKANETKLAFDPLMGVMEETQTACLAATHVSREGNILNRRFGERTRAVIKITRPDDAQPNRLKVWVDKTDDRKPSPLGLTFSDGRNQYDDRPPEAPEPGKPGRKPEKSTGFADWLLRYLEPGPAAVVDIVAAARDGELLPSPTDKTPKPSLSPLYAARERIPRVFPGYTVDEFESLTKKGKTLKHWQLVKPPATAATTVEPAESDGEGDDDLPF